MPEKIPSLFTLVVVIAVARLFGMLFRRMGQPSVMGEVFGGIFLGPSIFGLFFPGAMTVLFPPTSLAFLNHVAEIGIILYLFIMGLELDLPRLGRSASSAVVVSQLSIVLPFTLGLFLAGILSSRYAPAQIGHFEFTLFIGISLSITAFPVLARILADSPLHKTKLGDLALTCAAVDDITAWCLVAVITGLLNSSIGSAVWTVIFTILYLFFMFYVARPLLVRALPRLEKSAEKISRSLLALVVIGAFCSAAITDIIGIHAFFGAFLFGAIIPHDSRIARDITERLEDFVAILFLPAFFALTGLRTQVGLLSSSTDWLICLLIIVFAVAGKFGGAFVGARITGSPIREASTLGILMNTRGLVELIVLNIGLSLGILTPTLFTMLVIMAVVTTFMTGPLLRWNLGRNS